MIASAPGRLYIVATPIGNLKDISARAIEVLQSVTCIACEDTRTALNLLGRLSIKPPRLVSFFEHNEQRRAEQIISLLKQGSDVALISAAGTPTISDPGFRLVERCVAEGIPLTPIPGPCAAIAALCASGLPTDKFLFLGFPARKGTKLSLFLDRVVEPERTCVFYLPARRLAEILDALDHRAPAARVVIARELTKPYEEFLRGTPAQLSASLAGRDIKGECTVVVYVGPPCGASAASPLGRGT